MLSDPFASAFFAQCSACTGLINRRGALQCEQCRCAYYCSEACRRLHASQPDNPALAHSAWCARVKLFRQRAPALADLPFSFAKLTTADAFDSQGLSRFLLERRLLGRGMWRRECYTWLGVHPRAAFDDLADLDIGAAPQPGDLAPDPEPFALPEEAAILAETPEFLSSSNADDQAEPRRHQLAGWADYYKLRGLPADSPACILLQWPLTLYHLLFDRLPADAPDAYKRLTASTGRLHRQRRIVVHVIGAEKEVELIPALCELARLAPDFCFRLALIGKDVSPSVHKSVHSECDGRFRVSVYRGLYHQVAAGLLSQQRKQPDQDSAAAGSDDELDDADAESSCPPRPDLIVAFNAGFAASISWPATLEFLKKLSIRTYVTDYCEFSMELSAVMCDKLRVGTLTPQRINPFRSPIRVPNEQLDLPSYSNAFISELVYPA